VGRKGKQAGGGKLGRGKGVGPREARWAGGERRGRLGWWAKRERGGVEGFGKFSFFLNLFKLTFQTFEIELFSKHSKIFKTFF
jgi:hypothetical protein